MKEEENGVGTPFSVQDLCDRNHDDGRDGERVACSFNILRLRPCRQPLWLRFAETLRLGQVPSGTVHVPDMAPGLATLLAADLVPDLIPDLFSFGYQIMYAI